MHGADYSLTLRARAAIASTRVLLGEYQLSLVEMTAVMEAFLRSGKVDSLLEGSFREIEGDALRGLGRTAEAVTIYAESEALFELSAGPDSPHAMRIKGKREALEAKLADSDPAPLQR